MRAPSANATLPLASALSDGERRRLEIATALRELIDGDVHSSAEMQRVAHSFAVSVRSLYRYRRSLEEGDLLTSALEPRRPGPKPGHSRYSHEVDEIVAAVIRRDGLSDQRLPPSELLRLVKDECSRRGLPAGDWPGRKGVVTRFNRISARERAQKREGRKAAERFTARPGEFFETREPNEIWLIDHTLADIILVDRIHRQVLGWPTFTPIIDAHTRMIPGYHVSLGRPSVVQTAMALIHAIMPKDAWLEEHALHYEWPIHGLPNILHADNAREFHSRALRLGCSQHQILPQYREVGEPQHGALIERYIGTMMGKVHLLPGTTFSNVQMRGEYASEKKAVMTLDEFDRWLALQIIEYHATPHRGLDNFTPISRWKAAVS